MPVPVATCLRLSHNRKNEARDSLRKRQKIQAFCLGKGWLMAELGKDDGESKLM